MAVMKKDEHMRLLDNEEIEAYVKQIEKEKEEEVEKKKAKKLAKQQEAAKQNFSNYIQNKHHQALK